MTSSVNYTGTIPGGIKFVGTISVDRNPFGEFSGDGILTGFRILIELLSFRRSWTTYLFSLEVTRDVGSGIELF